MAARSGHEVTIPCGGPAARRAVLGQYYHISGTYLNAHTGEMALKEDNGGHHSGDAGVSGQADMGGLVAAVDGRKAVKSFSVNSLGLPPSHVHRFATCHCLGIFLRAVPDIPITL